KKAIVVGAGIGGLTAAVALRKVGIDVHVYERAAKLLPAGFGISVMSNAISALRAMGIDLALERRGRVVDISEIRTTSGRVMRRLPVQKLTEEVGAPCIAIHRADLQAALLEAAGDCPLHTGAVARKFERTPDGVRLTFEDGSHADADLLIGADGIHSVIRAQLTGTSEPREPRDGRFICWLAYTPFEHPRVPPGFSGHYWGTGQRFGIHDLGHGRIYWWGTKNMPRGEALRWSGGKDEVARLYQGWADEVQQAIRVTDPDKILAVPAQDRPFLERWGEGPVTLLGDAAHAMMPALAQGGSTSIEDAIVLARCLAGETDVERALRRYEARRRERMRQMVEMSAALGKTEQLETPVRRIVRDLFVRFASDDRLFAPFRFALTPPSFAAEPS
ncbi:MAG TPA: FAD-dependent monooxygenase, partial [Kofleriaceae bacterium]|nr:FAD-dependent monooxygenase [Kofleriaceae bacterium]